MADAVKNNGRSRRPPSHLRAEFNEDNFEPGNSHFPKNKDSQRQTSDPCSLQIMARLLSKFMTSANKKYVQCKALKTQQELNSQPKKTLNDVSKNSLKIDKNSKEDMITPTSRAQNSGQMGGMAVKPKLAGQSYVNSMESRQKKNALKSSESAVRTNIPPENYFSVQSMAKMSRQQLLKMVPTGIDPNYLKQHTKQLQEEQAPKKQPKVQVTTKQPRALIWRPDSKLFKRAAFHIGIAYNIHIDKVKEINPNYTTDDLDPTLISRRMKSHNIEQNKKRAEETERLRFQQEVSARQRVQTQPTKSEENEIKTEKKPVVIDLDQDEDDQHIQKMKQEKEERPGKQGQTIIQQQKEKIRQLKEQMQPQIEPESAQYRNISKKRIMIEEGKQKKTNQEVGASGKGEEGNTDKPQNL